MNNTVLYWILTGVAAVGLAVVVWFSRYFVTFGSSMAIVWPLIVLILVVAPVVVATLLKPEINPRTMRRNALIELAALVVLALGMGLTMVWSNHTFNTLAKSGQIKELVVDQTQEIPTLLRNFSQFESKTTNWLEERWRNMTDNDIKQEWTDGESRDAYLSGFKKELEKVNGEEWAGIGRQLKEQAFASNVTMMYLSDTIEAYTSKLVEQLDANVTRLKDDPYYKKVFDETVDDVRDWNYVRHGHANVRDIYTTRSPFNPLTAVVVVLLYAVALLPYIFTKRAINSHGLFAEAFGTHR